MTPEEKRTEKLARDAARKRAFRAKMTPEEAKAFRDKHRERSRAAVRKHYRKNRAGVLESAKKTRLKRLEHYRALGRAWYAANRERSKEHAKAWRLANNEAYRARSRAAAKKVYDRDPAASLAKLAAWAKAHPERAKAIAANRDAMRRFRMKNAKASANDPRTKAFIKHAKAMTSFVCAYCEREHAGQPQIEHMIPISRGGLHVMENLCHSCGPCNLSKGDQTAEEYRARLAARKNLPLLASA